MFYYAKSIGAKDEMNDILGKIAMRIHQLLTSGKDLTDGFLKPLMLMLGFPIDITATVPVTLASLADKVLDADPKDPKSQSVFDDFSAALTQGDDVKNLVDKAYSEEWD